MTWHAVKEVCCAGAQGKVQPPELKRFMDKKLSGEACLGHTSCCSY